MNTYTLQWNSHSLALGGKTRIMGVLNVTPDSFSDGGDFFSFEAAVEQAQKLIADGAHILDIGGESTRPFSEQVTIEEECRRVIPVIEAIAKHVSVPISVDTTKSAVAKQALEAGASMINDVSALRSDPLMAEVAAGYGVPVVLMHMKGTPKTMQTSPVYDDLMGEITAFLENQIQYAVEKGIHRQKIIVDPGIGFGKTMEHNLQIIKQLHLLEPLGVPILIGTSRKAFIRKLLGKKEIHPQATAVETGTQATVSAAALGGAHIVRVHDVAGTNSTLKIIDAIRNV
jgi:dihydropteroate synthase